MMREQDLTQGDVTLTQGRALHTQLAAGAVYPAGREELDGQVSRHTAEARAALFGSVQINTAKVARYSFLVEREQRLIFF